MTTVADVTAALESIAPLELAEDWDNVGLLLGAPDDRVSRALLTIDTTAEVVAEAIRKKAGLIVSYHPAIFDGLKRINDGPILDAARAGIAIHSPHTALDATDAGLNDWLVSGAGAGAAVALQPHAERPSGEDVKVVTYAPAEAVDAIRKAMAAAGAGTIGDYEQCSFEIDGRGTFRGGEATNPAIGRAGRLERVTEVRLEMVAAARDIGGVVQVLRATHPYEEPPVEVHPLAAVPQPHVGAGRVIALDRAIAVRELTERYKTHLGVDVVRVTRGGKKIKRVGVCAGAGGELLSSALAAGCDAFVTGEMRYHDVLAAKARGCTIVLAGHSNTERGYLPILKKRLAKLVSGVTFEVSRADKYPMDHV